MDEQQFDAMRQWRGFSSGDARKIERQFQQLATFGLGLWGRTADDLRRQLALDHPEIPAGCVLADLQHLLGQARAMLSAYPTMDHNMRILLDRCVGTEAIKIHGERLTVLEARYEIARRAIEWLESRGGTSSTEH